MIVSFGLDLEYGPPPLITVGDEFPWKLFSLWLFEMNAWPGLLYISALFDWSIWMKNSLRRSPVCVELSNEDLLLQWCLSFSRSSSIFAMMAADT